VPLRPISFKAFAFFISK
jgi:hypothetical protein